MQFLTLSLMYTYQQSIIIFLIIYSKLNPEHDAVSLTYILVRSRGTLLVKNMSSLNTMRRKEDNLRRPSTTVSD